MTQILKNIIQIGVADANDHVKNFILQNSSDYFIYLIEPNKHSIPLIKNAYSFINTKSIGNYAISTFDGEIDIYFNFYETGNSQQASVLKEHLIGHSQREEDITIVKVKCFTLETLINKILSLGKEKIHYLFMDTEGHDCDIILSTDFSKVDIEKIIFEVSHTERAFVKYGPKYNEVKKHLESYGYTKCCEFTNSGENECFKK